MRRLTRNLKPGASPDGLLQRSGPDVQWRPVSGIVRPLDQQATTREGQSNPQ